MIIDNKEKRSNYFTHGFHPYPAKFTPQVVSKFFNLYCQQGYRILDPFCGSGTTLVEATLNNMTSVGIDLNPIAWLISRAKTIDYTLDDLASSQDFIERIQMYTDNGFFSKHDFLKENLVIPEFPNRDHWFQPNVSLELSLLKNKIDYLPNENVKFLMMCAFSKIIVKVSNQDSEVRYTAKPKFHPDGFVIALFVSTVLKYLKILKLSEYSIKEKAEVFHGEALEVLNSLPSDSFDFVITSPPYINTFDYYLYHKLRMFWLGYDHKIVRRNEIGNHHRIDTKKFEIAKNEYIETMTHILFEISRVSKANSYFVMIIGDGIVEGKTIDMGEVIFNMTQNSNFSFEQIESVNLANITRSFNKKFTNAPKNEHTIILKNIKN